MNRWTGRGAVVVAVWAALNAVNAGVLFAFSARVSVQERAVYWAAVGLLSVTSALVLLVPRHRARSAPVPSGGRAANGAPAAAFAAACLVGGLAWVFGVFIAYFALPLIAFILARWRVEWAEQHREGP